MKKRKKILFAILGCIIIVGGFLTYMVFRTKSQVQELFLLNKLRQEEGYYMAEFEFKMLGITYLLDKGHYIESLKKINALHHQLKTKKISLKFQHFRIRKRKWNSI